MSAETGQPSWDESDEPVADARLAKMAEGVGLQGIMAECDIMLIARELLDRRRELWLPIAGPEEEREI